MLNRLGHRPINGPRRKTPRQDGLIDTRHHAPVLKAHRFASPRDEPVISLVSRLNARCCPSAVFLRVRAVIILAVERVFGRRTWTHIFVKRDECASPAIGHRDPTGAVILEHRCVGVKASVSRRTPDTIFGSSGQPVCCRILSPRPNKTVVALCSAPLPKMPSISELFAAAITATTPRGLVPSSRSIYKSQTPESLAGFETKWPSHVARITWKCSKGTVFTVEDLLNA